ncbi:MAG: hypothetical protein HQL15_09805 [Candidatus Omnitrophica bacterium]|nr:hypothetical protein [Candidatus Omnitrophota bacterium]
MQISNADLFDTVSDDYLSLYKGDKLRYDRVVELLNFKNDDVSKATGILQSSIRYDDKMSVELKERLGEWAILLNQVSIHFNGDAKKTTIWFMSPNPLLGYDAPRDMIRLGKFKRLYRFVVDALVENKG